MTMLNLLVYICPRFITRYYIYRTSVGIRVPGKLILAKSSDPKSVKPGDVLHTVSFFNFFGIPTFIKTKVTHH